MLQKFTVFLVSFCLAWLVIPQANAQDLIADCLGADPYRQVDETISACASALAMPNLERPIRAKLFAQQGEAFHWKPDPALAVAAFDEALALDTALNDARIEKGWALVRLQLYSAAAAIFEEAKKVDPGSARVTYALAWMQMNVTGGPDIVPLLEETLRRDPHFWLAQSILADYYIHVVPNNPEALKHYNLILDAEEADVNKVRFFGDDEFPVKDFYTESLYLKADLLRWMNKYDDAATILNDLVKRYPTEPQPLAKLAEIYNRRREFGLAYDSAQRALTLMPENITAQLAMEISASNLGKSGETLATAKALLEQHPRMRQAQWANVYYYMGLADKALNNRTAAKNDFLTALKLDPTYSAVVLTQVLQSGFYDGQTSDLWSPKADVALDACLIDPKYMALQ